MAYERRFVVPTSSGRGRYWAGDEQLHSFTLRETEGKDEEYAAERAKIAKSSSSEELIRVSLVAVNDVPVQQPYLVLNKWNSKARQLVADAFTELNTVSDGEIEDFRAANAEKPAADAE